MITILGVIVMEILTSMTLEQKVQEMMVLPEAEP